VQKGQREGEIAATI